MLKPPMPTYSEVYEQRTQWHDESHSQLAFFGKRQLASSNKHYDSRRGQHSNSSFSSQGRGFKATLGSSGNETKLLNTTSSSISAGGHRVIGPLLPDGTRLRRMS
ncbi:hypothetical protein Dimus_027406 [Dionaea muscipula]